MSTPLFIGPEERDALHDLRGRAAREPVDITRLNERFQTAEGKAEHVEAMTRLTIQIPADYLITFSIEIGHPCGICRHLSMSVNARGRVPIPESVWMVAEELGFVGGLEACSVWPEKLLRGENDIAINVVQPVAVTLPNEQGSARA